MFKKSHRKGLLIAGVIALGAGGALAAGGYDALREMFSGRAVFTDEQGNQHELEFQGTINGDGTAVWTGSDGQTFQMVPADPSQMQMVPEGTATDGAPAPADGQPRKMVLKRPGN